MSIPITTVLKIKPAVGLEEECLQWMQETAVIVSDFKGFLSREIYKSIDQEGVITTVFTFDSKENLDHWEESKTRSKRIELGESYVDHLVEKKQFTGLEFWFDSNDNSKKKPSPVRWKMLVVTIVIIFILINTFIPVVQLGLNMLDLNVLFQSLIGVTLMVSLMTYLIMPFVTKLLMTWLVKS